MTATDTPEVRQSRLARLLGLGLVGVVLLLYWPARTYDFVNLDDNTYLYENPVVSNGLTLKGVRWAFTADLAEQSPFADYWMPVTILSRMLDVTVFGMDPGPQHVVNVLIHALNAFLLFVLWHKLTRRLWVSLAIAALFAVHPIHVESVAWVSERKDVLGMFWYLLAALAYVSWCDIQTWPKYLAMLLAALLGMMTKPLIITLPAVLVLLDIWPLKRIPPQIPRSSGEWVLLSQRLGEKVPLLAISLLSAAITWRAHLLGGAVSRLADISFGDRVGNAGAAYGTYLFNLLVPTRLAVLYPWTQALAPWQVATGTFVLVCMTLVCLNLLDRAPWAAVGWLWFAGCLLPTVGLFQFGPQRLADRFAYVPAIGFYLLVVFAVAACADERPAWKRRLATLGILYIALLAVQTRRQLSHWRNSRALFTHALRVTDRNALAHNNLSVALTQNADYEQAAAHARRAVAINDGYVEAWINLGAALMLNDELPAAEDAFRKALSLRDTALEARINLANVVRQQGKMAEAHVHYQAVLEHFPDNAELLNQHGSVLAALGREQEALARFRAAVHSDPDLAEAHVNLARLLTYQDTPEQAIPHYRAALRAHPDWLGLHNELAWVLATHPNDAVRDPDLAIQIGERLTANGLQDSPSVLRTLAAAYAAAGRFPEAVDLASRALQRATEFGATQLAEELTYHLEFYRAGMPLRQLQPQPDAPPPSDTESDE